MIQKMVISTHTPLAGRDFGQFRRHVAGVHFYSHAPCGARPYIDNVREGLVNFYSHAPCGARPTHHLGNVQQFTFLLTRPLRGATIIPLFSYCYATISTHTPLAGRDLARLTILKFWVEFLLTRPLRGATYQNAGQHNGV